MQDSAALRQHARNQGLLRVLRAVAIVALVALIAIGGSRLAILGATIGSKTYMAAAFVIIVVPLALFVAVRWPFIFPFGLLVIVAPFDPILGLFSSSYGTLTKLIAGCAGIAFLFWLVRTRTCAKPPTAVYAWFGVLVWMSLSVFWAMDPVRAYQHVETYALLFVLYLVISLTPISEKQHRWFVYSVALSGIASAALSVYLAHTGSYLFNENTNGVASTRFEITTGNAKLGPDEFAAAQILPIAIVLMWALRRRWSLAKLALIGLFLLMVAGIYVSGTRGAEVGVAAMIGYMILRSRYKGQLITFSLLALLASFVMPNSPWVRFATAGSTGGSGRLPIWKVGLAAFKHHWLFGAGVGNFATAYNQSFINVFEKIYTKWSAAPHNIVVEAAVELGIIGVVMFVGAWYLQLSALRVIPRSSRFYDMRIALEAAVIALFVDGLTVGIMQDKFTWLLFGLVAATRTVALTTSEAAATRRTSYLVRVFEPEALKQPALS